MDFKLTDKQLQLREEVRSFLKETKASGKYEFLNNGFLHVGARDFSKEVAKKGWIGMTWPKEFGGQGLGYLDRLIMLEEMFNFGAPMASHYMGDRQVGPGIIHFGSDFLKQEFLPKLINADITFCLLFSEPDAGSDLANCRTKAEEDGDYFIINGQKVWNSNAHVSEWGWALVRTNFDPEISRYKSFSEIIIDMNSPGVTVRPIINMVGVHSFNEVFFDNVKVHKKYIVGKMGNGFKQIMTNLDYERAGIDRLMQNHLVKGALIDYVKTTKKDGKPLSENPLIREKIAELEVEFQVFRLYVYYISSLLDQGIIPSSQAAMGKTVCTLYEAKLSDVAATIVGLHGLLMPDSPEAFLDGMIGESYLWSPSFTLQGGSVEVLKNITARRGLKMAT
ncbi:MAG: acyl-CoA dehydrogenase family protein [Spirochaetota bacterium]|nr:acyl-CoA dehydrogenase family protein [Spirochaetota bacterium]